VGGNINIYYLRKVRQLVHLLSYLVKKTAYNAVFDYCITAAVITMRWVILAGGGRLGLMLVEDL